jgi:hypothetical protein
MVIHCPSTPAAAGHEIQKDVANHAAAPVDSELSNCLCGLSQSGITAKVAVAEPISAKETFIA